MHPKKLLLTLALLPALTATSQSRADTALYATIFTRDSLLFNAGFNRCNLQPFNDVLDSSFEFYHDEAGITGSKAAFISSVRDGLCKLPYKAQRRLVSMQVFPLRNGSALYGAMQTGTHQFYAIEPGKAPYLTSTAQFSHLWLLHGGRWQLSRSISYNHSKPLNAQPEPTK